MNCRFLATALTGLVLTACATFVRGSQERYEIQSEPDGAFAYVELTPYCDRDCMRQNYPDAIIGDAYGQPRPMSCDTPCALVVDRKDVMTVKIRKKGYRDRVVVVNPQHRAGIAASAGNVAIGGAAGLLVDAASGAWADHCPNPLVVRLVPLGSQDPDPPLGTGCAAKPIYDVAGKPSY